MKNFNIFGVHRNIHFFGEVGFEASRKTNMYGGLPKMGGGLGQFADLRGTWQKRRGGVFEGGADTPIHTMAFNCQKLSQT